MEELFSVCIGGEAQALVHGSFLCALEAEPEYRQKNS